MHTWCNRVDVSLHVHEELIGFLDLSRELLTVRHQRITVCLLHIYIRKQRYMYTYRFIYACTYICLICQVSIYKLHVTMNWSSAGSAGCSCTWLSSEFDSSSSARDESRPTISGGAPTLRANCWELKAENR
jgi:hypothetical protein